MLLNEERIGEIRFDVTIALIVKGLILKIQGGKILEVKTGSCQGKGTVAIAGETIFERKSEEIALPGVISFDKGKPIEASGAPVALKCITSVCHCESQIDQESLHHLG